MAAILHFRVLILSLNLEQIIYSYLNLHVSGLEQMFKYSFELATLKYE